MTSSARARSRAELASLSVSAADVARFRATYASVTDDEALAALELLARTEGIVCALESAHAIAYLRVLAPRLGPDAVVVVNVSVRDGKVTPKPHRVDVKLGANVRLQVTSDEDDVLHVHGYEVEEPLEAGHTTTVELTADQPGVFEVETHESELLLLQLAVR